MEPWYSQSESNLVDAIEEGKIVRVSEEYARREGLTILRIHKQEEENKAKLKKNQEEEYISPYDLRKPLNWRKDQVYSELVENFHWQISKKRKALGLTRKKLAERINETEYTIKLIENGILPRGDFVIINKLQNLFSINLRKDKRDFVQSPRSFLKENPENQQEKTDKPKENVSGNDIEIIE